jgi:uncharacterized protein YjbI with pentapeptide repeats
MAKGSDNTFGESLEERQRRVDAILEKHRDWLDKREHEEDRADLSGMNLRDVSLREADLRGAILGNAQVYDADFYGTSLREIDLRNVEGLTECQLAGTDLSHAILPSEPPGIGKFGALDQIKDISVQARTLLWITIGACVFAVVTMSVANDAIILSHLGSTLLPVVNINVPIGMFFWCMPVVLLGLYLYLHFQLQYLWNGLAGLPSFFPDGVSLDERAYPLFLRSLVRIYVPLLKKHRPPQWWLQAYASVAAAWWLVPSTIFLFWIRYLRMHEMWVTLWHIAVLALSVWFGFATYGLSVHALSGRGGPAACAGVQDSKKSPQSPNSRGLAPAVAVLIFCSLVSLAVIRVENHGDLLRSCFYPTQETSKPISVSNGPSESIAQEGGLRQWIRRQICADLSFGEVSHKPDGWLGFREEDRKQLLGVKGALLKGVNLQGADGRGAFLVDATLVEADLQGADFSRADLRKSNLNGANLYRAKLRNAILMGAHLDGCCLRNADLKSVRLSALYILKTSSSEVCCLRTSLSFACLENANLFNADLDDAYLEGTSLKGADLGNAKLRDAVLKDADLSGAVLFDTDLSGADLSESKGLTDEQLKEACADRKPTLPGGMRVEKRCRRTDEVLQKKDRCRSCD